MCKGISCFLEDIDAILPNFNFVFFRQILTPHSRVSKHIRRNFGFFVPVVYNISKSSEPCFFRFPQIRFSENDSGLFLELFGVSWCLHNQEYLVFGVMVTSARSRNHENDGFSGSSKMNPKSN